MIAKLWTLRMTTDANGAASASRPLIGRLLAVDVDLGTLDTSDITVKDEAGTTLLSVVGLAAAARYNPTVAAQNNAGANIAGSYVPPAVLGALTVTLAGGGANKTGTIKLLCER
jgi:hypothetical protein